MHKMTELPTAVNETLNDMHDALIAIVDITYHNKSKPPTTITDDLIFIRETATKCHTALHQVEALLDLARKRRPRIPTVLATKPGLCPPVLYTSRKRIKGGKP